MSWKTLSIALAAMMLGPGMTGQLVAKEANEPAMRLHVGDTGILCVRLPCPTRGVFIPAGHGLEVRKNLLYTDLDGQTPPPLMIGEKAAIDAVTKAWSDRQCLAIKGRMIAGEAGQPRLRIDRIIGPCGGQAE